ncbi:MAG: hypothetical protein HYY18_21480 [Planctomycetes bacterium]|nr:hypothetical protein [Planctomycetota bacterium]
MLKRISVALILASTACAEEPVEMKWSLAKGDKFALEVSLDAASETRDADGKYETTRTMKLSAVMEVMEAGEDGAEVEIRIQRTSGKMRDIDGEIEDTPLDSEARDWTPIAATVTKGGELKIDLKTLMQTSEIMIADCLMGLFPPLPDHAVKSKDTWPGLDTANSEKLQVASFARKSGKVEATIEGAAGSEEKVPAEGERKAGIRKIQGTSKAVFDATDGCLRSVSLQMSSEAREETKHKPFQTQSLRRTATVTRIKPGK